MNITPIRYKSIENIYKTNKIQEKIEVKTKNMDTVEISELGKYLSKVDSSKDSVDIEKVNEIKRKIETGTYKIDSKDLAKKIIENMRGEK